MRKGLCFTFTILLLLLIFSVTGLAYADNARNPLALDLVVIIENSRRMNVAAGISDDGGVQIDADGLRFDAASALISMCDTQYSRATYYLFSEKLYAFNQDLKGLGKVQEISPDDISLFDISLPTHKPQRQRMMAGLNGADIRNGYGTYKGADIGEAISAAVSVQMRDGNSKNRKVIVLLTAGNNRLSAESRAKAMEAKRLAEENDIEIYCVVLKDDTSARMLQELATKPTNYQFSSSPEDLVDVFRAFFADMIGAEPMESKPKLLDDGKYEIELNVPNASVEEVNIIVPTKQIEGLSLSDQKGNLIVKPDDDLLINVNRNFISYKFIKPNPEKYYLRYVSDDDQNVVVQYVFSYSVQVSASVNAKKINKHEPVTFTAQYVENKIPTTDNKLYQIPATLTLWKGDQLIGQIKWRM